MASPAEKKDDKQARPAASEPPAPPQERIKTALQIIERYGKAEGQRHKAWVMDQVVRALLGQEEAYNKWVLDMRSDWDEVFEVYDYHWDTGVSP